jgi:hypothetical protein
MDKGMYLDRNLEAYKSFFDHEWARSFSQQTTGTPLEEIFFDLQWAWKGAANTFFMPWLTVSTMVRAALAAATDHAFPTRFTAAMVQRLPQRAGLRNMAKQRLVQEIQQIAQEVRAVEEQSPAVETEMVWQRMLEQSEFRLSIWGSQRLSYAAVYYAYEDFLARCYRLSTGQPDYRLMPGFSQDFRKQYGAELRDYCWSDANVNVARLTRHALVHNGGRLTSDLKKLKHGLKLHGEDIQIFPAFTKSHYELLKDRVTKFLSDREGPLGKGPTARSASASGVPTP